LDGSGGKETIPLYGKARYVKMSGIGRGSSSGYSLYEFEVRAYREGDLKPVYDIPDIPEASAVQVGAGSYEINDITQLEPKNPKYRTSDIEGPIPSNDWWQSILISNLGDGNSLITLPLKNRYTKQGLSVLNPGAGFASADGGSIDADGDPDLYLSTNTINPAGMQTKISSYGDYSATVILSDDDTAKMSTTFVKGSPYLFNTFENPDAVIIQSPAITRLFNDQNEPVLLNDGDTLTADHIGIEVTNKDKAPVPQTFIRSYGIFAPEGTVFMKLGNTIKIKLGGGEDYLSLATLPSPSELNEFYRHAYAFVSGTEVDYSFNQKESTVTTNFHSSTELKRPGFSSDTIMALLPHQWKITATPLTELSYPSIRGVLKLVEGSSFTTSDRFYGIIPQFVEPGDSTYSRAQLIAYLDQLDADLAGNLMIADPYWQGKKLHPLALAVLISDQLGDGERKARYLANLKTILTDWYTYSPDEPLHSYYFHYSQAWGALFPYSSGFGVNTGLTDHHFTYGYYIFASAVLATYDKEFLADYGDMVEVLIRDYANPSKTDGEFPWMRNFDPYEGHSWAGGYADNRSGNNQEAAGEALFSWVGEYMWGLVTGNDAYRDAGIWGFTTEEKAVEQYWFNYDDDNWVEGYNHATAGQVYGSAYLFGTFFSGDPQSIYGIHWLPPAEWMTYYGREPEKTANLYAGLIKDLGKKEDTWQHIIWPFESISDPQAVLDKWDTTNMQQNEAFNAYWFVHSMATLGTRTTDIWADNPAVTVYKKADSYTAQIWNPSDNAVTVHFYNAAGALGSAKVYSHGQVSVDPLKHTVLEAPDLSGAVQYLDRSQWQITASASAEPVANLVDGKLSTRWSSGRTQRLGEVLQIDLGSEQTFDTLFMNSGTSYGDYAHGYEISVSRDGENWGETVVAGVGTSPSVAVSLPAQTAKYIRITLTASSDSWWSIAELKVAKFGKGLSETPEDTLEDRSGWKVTAASSYAADLPANMLDGNGTTLWSSGREQTSGQWIQVDLGSKQRFDSIVMNPGNSADDYPRGYRTGRYVKLVQTGEANKWWSIAELYIHNYGNGKQKPVDPQSWTLTASSTAGGETVNAMLDGSPATRWSSGREQQRGQWIQLDLGRAQAIDQLVMDSGSSCDDYAHGYEVYVSADGEHWGIPAATGKGTSSVVTAAFPLQTVRYVKVILTAADPHWWSVSGLSLYTADEDQSLPQPGAADPLALDRSSWSVTDSTYGMGASTLEMLDADKNSRWTTRTPQAAGQWIQLDLGSRQQFRELVMNSEGSENDYARGYQVMLSENGTEWRLVAGEKGTSSLIRSAFPVQTARYVRIVLTEAAPQWWWSVSELNLYM
ncbi:hypothetical protein KC345_g8333, partial [Hortaea werneckii]